VPRPDSENDQDSSTAVPPSLTRRSTFRLLGGAAAGAVLLDAGGSVLSPATASAATLVPQAGPVPLVIDQTLTTDNLTVLLGTSAAHPSDMTVYGANEGRKNFYIQNFMSTSDSLSCRSRWLRRPSTGSPGCSRPSRTSS